MSITNSKDQYLLEEDLPWCKDVVYLDEGDGQHHLHRDSTHTSYGGHRYFAVVVDD
jgi:hypothetical protein